jgi:GxxExxY protein
MEIERQKALPIRYKGTTLADPLRLDILVAGRVIVEAKAVVQYNPIFVAQCLTYLRLSGLKLGLVINFGEARVATGIHRVVNNF